MQLYEMDIARVVVTGSTLFTDQALVTRVLDEVSAVARERGGSFRILTGTADGADEFARTWARENQLPLFAENLDDGPYPAPMHLYNDGLLALGPDLVLAFKGNLAADWDSPDCVAGTEHMCRIAAEASVPVLLNGNEWLVSGHAEPQRFPKAFATVSAVPLGGPVLQTVQADITELKVDVIVNAANSSLLGGGGVDGAIHRAAGPTLLEECRAVVARQGGCQTGEAVLTGAGALVARYIVHTVGPVFNDAPTDDSVLARCYAESLRLASEAGAESIAFPNISTGVYRFPKDLACAVAIDAVQKWFVDNPASSIDRVVFCCFDAENAELYADALGSEG